MKHCYSKLGVNYLYASKGEVATEQKINMWAKMYPSYYTHTRLKKAMKMKGSLATDCSGLISWYTGIMRGSQGYYDTAVKRGSIKDIPERVGVAVWRKGHIGVYVGFGLVVEAKGIDYGVVVTKLKDGNWTHWLQLKDIAYFDYEPEYKINKNSKRTDVAFLQTTLNTKGYNLNVDGIYGTKTAQAVLDFWNKYGWSIKGQTGYSVGKDTIKALEK